ncbi:hypothetical protein MTO96_008497 [Rhipicephalus appendiculatus]
MEDAVAKRRARATRPVPATSLRRRPQCGRAAASPFQLSRPKALDDDEEEVCLKQAPERDGLAEDERFLDDDDGRRGLNRSARRTPVE